MSSVPRWSLAAAVLALALSACVPSRPDDDNWREDAGITLTDVAGQLETAALVLEHDQDLLGGYDVVVLAQAEELAGTTADSFTSQQPPDAYAVKQYARVSSVLDDALSALADARIAAVRDDTAAYPGLVRQLHRLGDQLKRLAARVSQGQA